MNSQPEYAPLYTNEERMRLLKRYALVVVVILLVGILGLQPFLIDYINTAHCQSYYGVSGLVMLVYVLFAGMPLSVGVVFQVAMTPLALRIVRQRRSPPEGVKVFRQTVVTRGTMALVKGYFLLLIMPLLFIVITSVGVVYADRFVQSINPDKLDYNICVERKNQQSGL